MQFVSVAGRGLTFITVVSCIVDIVRLLCDWFDDAAGTK